MRGEVCRKDHFCDDVLDVGRFIGCVALQEVDLTISSKDSPQLIEVHLF